ncbi:MAG: DUF4956 domain-containing protein [Planctomycetes bacterium]|nr:DUF4956 domain-containing protein [Planctomycetota bacterium]
MNDVIMSDWWNSIDESISNSAPTVVTRLILAWAAGWFISLLARSNRVPDQDNTFPPTLILLSVLIAIVTQIIGNNVARAFSLVGALSIVRFRTAVPTTRDIAYVLAAVVIGMAIGAGQIVVAALGMMAVVAVSFVNLGRGPAQLSTTPVGALTMQLTLGGNAVANEFLKRVCDRFTLVAISTARKGAAMSYTYRVFLRPETAPSEVIEELNRLEVVESISWESIK